MVAPGIAVISEHVNSSALEGVVKKALLAMLDDEERIEPRAIEAVVDINELPSCATLFQSPVKEKNLAL
jgi:hypothetical protein